MVLAWTFGIQAPARHADDSVMALAISRFPDDPPIILETAHGERIEIDVERVNERGRVTVFIKAPRTVRIYRGEPGASAAER